MTNDSRDDSIKYKTPTYLFSLYVKRYTEWIYVVIPSLFSCFFAVLVSLHSATF